MDNVVILLLVFGGELLLVWLVSLRIRSNRAAGQRELPRQRGFDVLPPDRK